MYNFNTKGLNSSIKNPFKVDLYYLIKGSRKITEIKACRRETRAYSFNLKLLICRSKIIYKIQL